MYLLWTAFVGLFGFHLSHGLYTSSLLCWTSIESYNKTTINRVGRKIVNEALSSNPTFDIYFGIDGWMLAMLTAGMSPVTSLVDALCQVALMGLLRLVSLFYLIDFARMTQNCHDRKTAPKDKGKSD